MKRTVFKKSYRVRINYTCLNTTVIKRKKVKNKIKKNFLKPISLHFGETRVCDKLEDYKVMIVYK